ncbi:hypothetical protein MRX96_036945 [Rhipicephalus microplus]
MEERRKESEAGSAARGERAPIAIASGWPSNGHRQGPFSPDAFSFRHGQRKKDGGGDEESALLPRGSLNAPFRLCRRDVEKASTTSFPVLIYFPRRLGTPEGSAPPTLTPRQPTTERRKGRSSLHPLPTLLPPPPLRRQQCFRCSRRIKRTLFLCLFTTRASLPHRPMRRGALGGKA